MSDVHLYFTVMLMLMILQ